MDRIYTSAIRPLVPSDNHDQSSLVSCCILHRLEYFTCPRPIITIYLNFLSMAKDIPVSTVISWRHHYLTLLQHTLPWSKNGCCYILVTQKLGLIELID